MYIVSRCVNKPTKEMINTTAFYATIFNEIDVYNTPILSLQAKYGAKYFPQSFALLAQSYCQMAPDDFRPKEIPLDQVTLKTITNCFETAYAEAEMNDLGLPGFLQGNAFDIDLLSVDDFVLLKTLIHADPSPYWKEGAQKEIDILWAIETLGRNKVHELLMSAATSPTPSESDAHED